MSFPIHTGESLLELRQALQLVGKLISQVGLANSIPISDANGKIDPAYIPVIPLGSLPAHHTTHQPGGSDPLDVDSAAATGSLRTLGAGAQQACSGSDARLSNARTPTAHATTHQPGGSDAMAVDAVAATGSLRTLGNGAQQACAGNDGRLSDSRNPLGHHATHEPGGSDPMATDAAAATASLRTLGTGAAQACAGNDSRLSDARVPTGAAGGDLAGNYASPTLAAAIATIVEFSNLRIKSGSWIYFNDASGATHQLWIKNAAPTANATGDWWFDTTNNVINYWNGSAWTLLYGEPWITSFVPAISQPGGAIAATVTCRYKTIGKTVFFEINAEVTSETNPLAYITFTLPKNVQSNTAFAAFVVKTGVNNPCLAMVHRNGAGGDYGANILYIFSYDGVTYPSRGAVPTYSLFVSGVYEST